MIVFCCAFCVAFGCGTTRNTDTARAATEMLLVSQAIDRAVEEVNFSALANRTVFLDVTYLDASTVDRGYLVSSVRHHLAASGALLNDDKKAVEFVVELRAGTIGTDRSTMLIGTPAISMPAIVPGVPSSIPEIALYKRNDQKGVAKIGVFAYHRATGRGIWQTDTIQEVSTLKDRWVLGSGPYSSGSIRKSTQFAGHEIPDIPLISSTPPEDPNLLHATMISELGPQPATLGLIGGMHAGVAATK